MFEAKLLILGEGNAGKTTLANKIVDENYKPTKSEKSTEGITVKHINFYSDIVKAKFRLNIWDFGGQEIYHTTHQFFLTKRSLYVLVSDTRADDTDFNYWLRIVDILSGNSPILIVQNEKQDRVKLIDQTAIRKKFSNLLDILRANLWTDRGFSELLNEIKYQAIKLPHIGNELPLSWQQIRKKLEKTAFKKNYISFEKYVRICRNYNLIGIEKALFLSEYLHDLGIILHFQSNPILKHIVILNPIWATQAVYKVLDNYEVIQKRGKFNFFDINKIWNEDIYIGMHHELLELMTKFDLCYRIENSDEFIAPQLLEISQPNYELDDQLNIKLRYFYSFMPKGIILRFIVRMYHYIEDHKNVWRNGVVLKRNNTFAEIIEDYEEKTINIQVSGFEGNEFLGIIQEEIDQINIEFSGLKCSKLIPCNCIHCSSNQVTHFFQENLLRKYIEKGRKTIVCENSLVDVEISPLLSCFSQISLIKNLDENNIKISRDLISQGRIIDSLNKLLMTVKGKNKDFYDQIYFYISSYNSLNADKNKGVVSNQVLLVERNKLINGIIDLISQIEDN